MSEEQQIEAPDDEDVAVVIEDTPAEGEHAAETPEGEPAKPENVASEDDLAALKAQLKEAQDRERRANQRAEELTRDVNDSRTEREREVQERFRAQEIAAANSIAAATAEAQSIEQEIERLANNGGSGAELAQAYRRLSRAENNLLDAERQREWVDQQRAGYKQALEAEQARQQEEARRQREQPQVSQRSMDWIRAHPQMDSDPVFRNAAIGAHNLAIQRRIPVDSDAYFEFIETQLGEREAVPAAEAEAPRRRPLASAPPSRSTPTAQRQNERRLTLTAAEKDMADATMSHIPDPAERYKRYALNKQRMLAENPLQ